MERDKINIFEKITKGVDVSYKKEDLVILLKFMQIPKNLTKFFLYLYVIYLKKNHNIFLYHFFY